MSVPAPEAQSVVQSSTTQVVEAVPASLPASPVAKPLRVAGTAVHAGTALARVQAVAGQLIPQLQYQVVRLGVAGQAGLAALTAAVAISIGALVPTYHALQTLNVDIARVQHPFAVNGIEQAVPRLVASLPTRAQIPAVLGQVFAEARAANVPLSSGHYVYTPAKAGAIAHYEFEFPVKAGYPEIRTFINRTLTAVPAAALDKLHIERKAVGDPAVSADIGFVVYVRSGEGS